MPDGGASFQLGTRLFLPVASRWLSWRTAPSTCWPS